MAHELHAHELHDCETEAPSEFRKSSLFQQPELQLGFASTFAANTSPKRQRVSSCAFANAVCVVIPFRPIFTRLGFGLVLPMQRGRNLGLPTRIISAKLRFSAFKPNSCSWM